MLVGPTSGKLQRHGFTLVELLVVMGIIGVLIAILLPVIGRVRQQAMATQCASNLRQIAAGWMMYATTYGGTAAPMRLPEVGPDGAVHDLGRGPHFRPRWFDLAGAQLKTHASPRPQASAAEPEAPIENQLFLCPTVDDWRSPRNYAYGYNYQFLGNPRTKANGEYVNFPVRVGRLSAAQTVLAADSMGTAAGKAKTSRRGYRADGSADLFAAGNHGYTIDPPRLTDTSDYCEDEARTPADRSAPDPRHSRKANVAFCDGHVELMALEDLGYIVRPDGTVAVSAPGAHNQLFSGSGRDDDPPPVL